MTSVPTPHDRLARGVLARPDQAAGLLRSILPAELVCQFDLERMVVVDPNFVDEILR